MGFCEHGNEPSGSIKCRKFFDSEELGALQEGFCSMCLVSHSASWLINQSVRI